MYHAMLTLQGKIQHDLGTLLVRIGAANTKEDIQDYMSV